MHEETGTESSPYDEEHLNFSADAEEEQCKYGNMQQRLFVCRLLCYRFAACHAMSVEQ